MRRAIFAIFCFLLPVAGQPAPAAGQTYVYSQDSIQTDPFQAWLEGVKQEAIESGISAGTVQAALSDVTLDEQVIELDQGQPETTTTFDVYSARTVSLSRVEEGGALLAEHAVLLRKIGRQYGVAPEVIVALWGIESNFGRNGGNFSIVDSLATLAYEGRRASFFRRELISALRILDQEHMPPAYLRGSWAGAMGQCQFMPSTYLRYAVDYARKGRRDIWENKADVFASIANYIAAEGWRNELTWGREVMLKRPVPAELVGLDRKLPLTEWSRKGVRKLDGTALPARALEASLVQPDGFDGRSFLVYDNFRALMRWNRSTYFAASVGLLADEIKRSP